MFNEKFSHAAKFTVKSDDFPFVSLKDLVQENGHRVLKVQGMFVFTSKKGKGKGKERPVLIAENHKINLPDHCLSDVKKIIEIPEYVEAVNAGKCGFQTTEYEDENYGNGTCYSGIFVDIE